MNIQWFPGHMAKTRRLITENLKLVDCVIEVADARLPRASRGPLLSELIGNRPRILVLNKADIADSRVNALWLDHYKACGVRAVLTNSRDSKVYGCIFSAITEVLAEKLARRKERGIAGKPVRVMVVGVPNVGKSTLINSLSGRKSAKTGDRPGVTTGKQWINVKSLELLDTPGILWHKFDDPGDGLKLAFSGAIRDDIYDKEELAALLLEFLRDNYAESLCARYKLDGVENLSGAEILESVCRSRGFLISGGEPDTGRGAGIVLDEFRAAKIGRISLERP